MRKRRKPHVSEGEINMTPMIDIVFQMIIFFVLTVEMDRQSMMETITLAMAPHGPAVEQKDPRTVTIDLDENGRIYISRTQLTVGTLRGVLAKTVSVAGRQIPVVIRADGETRHERVRQVMDACKDVGLWKVKFAAIKDAVKKR